MSPTDAPPAQKRPPERGGQVVSAICLPVEAKPADVTPGKIVRDSYRLLLGSVELVGSDGAVVTGEYGYLRFPLEAFGEWCDGSLVLKVSPTISKGWSLNNSRSERPLSTHSERIGYAETRSRI
jgi:hypothetical protein